MLAKTFGATVKAIYVDTGLEDIEFPEETVADDVFEGVHPSVKGLVVANTIVRAQRRRLRRRGRARRRRQAHRRDRRGSGRRPDRRRRHRSHRASSASRSAVGGGDRRQGVADPRARRQGRLRAEGAMAPSPADAHVGDTSDRGSRRDDAAHQARRARRHHRERRHACSCAQRKLSFTYGAIFFAVTLLIPASSVWWQGWYAGPDLGRLHRQLPVRLAALLRLPVGDGVDVLEAGRQARRQAQWTWPMQDRDRAQAAKRR